MLAGWIQPAEGRIERHGIDRIGWIFQNPHGTANRTALDHVTLPLIARGERRAPADQKARQILARFGLDHVADRPFHALSGGEGQRLMLARGIAVAPSLMLVDEPTAQLDPRTSTAVVEALSNIATAGIIIVVATHDERTCAACTDHIDLGSVQADDA